MGIALSNGVSPSLKMGKVVDKSVIGHSPNKPVVVIGELCLSRGLAYGLVGVGGNLREGESGCCREALHSASSARRIAYHRHRLKGD